MCQTSFAARLMYRPKVKTTDAWVEAVAKEAMKSKMAIDREWDFETTVAVVNEEIQRKLCPANGRDALCPAQEARFDPQYHLWASRAAEKIKADCHLDPEALAMGDFTALELIEIEARRFECLDNALGDYLAHVLRDAAAKVELTGTYDWTLQQERLLTVAS